MWRSTHDHNFRNNVHPLSFAQRNGDGCQRYCWFHSRSCFCNRLPKASCSSSSMVSFTYFSTPFTIRTQQAVLSWNRDGPEFQDFHDLHDDKRKRSRLRPFESSLLLEISDRYEAVYILCINVPFRSVLLCQAWWNIGLFRQFSNQRWSIVWITSERLIVVRIAAFILATGFTVAVHRSEGRQ